jgi:hypothetical protein
MPRHRGTTPPAYAWDWFARQRPVWTEVARRLSAASASARGPHRDVPDWSDLLGPNSSRSAEPSRRDWSTLGTRAEFVAALRDEYDTDPEVRAVTEAVVIELAFLGRLGTSLAARGVLAPPRGMRWWWEHLGGAIVTSPADREATLRRPAVPSGTRSDSETSAQLPVQLRFVDVLVGYGDGFTPPSRADDGD